MNPLVSIIIPVYNAQDYLGACIDSLLVQSYSNFEILLVNDGSTDSTLKLMQEYAVKDSRVKVFNKANAGVSSARNLGITQCQGDYTIFIDSDDVIHYEYIELLLKKAVSENSDITICDYYVTEGGSENVISYSGSEDITCYISEILNHNVWGVLWNKMFKSSLYKSNGIFFPDGINMWEDIYFCINTLVVAKKISFVERPLYYYTIRKGSLVNTNMSMRRIDDQISIVSMLSENDKIKSLKSLNTSKLYAKGGLITIPSMFNVRKWRQTMPVNIFGILHSNISIKHKAVALFVSLRLTRVAKIAISIFNK